MMRTWFKENAKTIVAISTVVSVVTHATLITAWVFGTMPAPGLPPESIANHVFYLPPPDRVAAHASSGESVHYVRVGTNGDGPGEGPRLEGDAKPTSVDQTKGNAAPVNTDTVSAEQKIQTEGTDSVFTVLDVDTAVVRTANSAAPAYPLDLLKAHIEGYVNAQYVVDTTGLADSASFNVLKATNPAFEKAVREVLPRMRFMPAKIGSMKVKQLVQQQFSFKITGDTLPTKKKP